MTGKNDIAVVIPIWQRVKELLTILGGLVGQTRGADEVIVVCLGDDKGSIAAVKSWSNFLGKVLTRVLCNISKPSCSFLYLI
jgi:GT2 family glycosyltransferase